jgi:hypothetical protein
MVASAGAAARRGRAGSVRVAAVAHAAPRRGTARTAPALAPPAAGGATRSPALRLTSATVPARVAGAVPTRIEQGDAAGRSTPSSRTAEAPRAAAKPVAAKAAAPRPAAATTQPRRSGT